MSLFTMKSLLWSLSPSLFLSLSLSYSLLPSQPISQYEAIPESLKNMLLVMSTQGIFDNLMNPKSQSDVDSPKQQLWGITWRRIDTFLPNFIQELFPNFAPPTTVEATPKAQDIHDEVKSTKEAKDDDDQSGSGSTVVSTPPVAVPVQVISRGNSSPPPGPDAGSPSRSPVQQQGNITGKNE